MKYEMPHMEVIILEKLYVITTSNTLTTKPSGDGLIIDSEDLEF